MQAHDFTGRVRAAEQKLFRIAYSDPSRAAQPAHMCMPEPQRFQQDGYALQVNVVDIAPTRSLIDFWVYPDKPGMQARPYVLLNPAGEPICAYPLENFSDYPPEFIRPIHYQTDQPLSDMPEAVTIVPAYFAGDGSERRVGGYLMDEAVTVRLDRVVPRAKAVAAQLPSVAEMGERFFGEDWPKLKPSTRLSVEDYGEDYVGYESDPPGEDRIGEYWMDINVGRPGYVMMQRPFGLPERSKQDMLAGKERSTVPGIYTRDEAEAMAKKALGDVLGTDTSKLLIAQEYADQEDRERSSRYDFYYVYVCDGMLLTTENQTQISAIVTNEGVVDINGRALAVSYRDE